MYFVYLYDGWERAQADEHYIHQPLVIKKDKRSSLIAYSFNASFVAFSDKCFLHFSYAIFSFFLLFNV